MVVVGQASPEAQNTSLPDSRTVWMLFIVARSALRIDRPWQTLSTAWMHCDLSERD